METQKIVNLLNGSDNENSEFGRSKFVRNLVQKNCTSLTVKQQALIQKMNK